MGKYLAKTFAAQSRHEALGMTRRWSSSRDWPGSGRIRLEPSLTSDWKERIFYNKKLETEHVDRGTFTKVGSSDEMVAYFAKKAERQRSEKIKRRLTNA